MSDALRDSQVFVHFAAGPDGEVTGQLAVGCADGVDVSAVLVAAAALLVDAANGVEGLGPEGVPPNRAERRRRQKQGRRDWT